MATRKKSNKPHAQTLGASLAAFQDAQSQCPSWPSVVPLPPPGQPREVAMRYFEMHWQSRAPSDWHEHELSQLAELASVSELRDRLFAEFSAAGGLTQTAKGWPAADPRVAVWSQLSARTSKLSIALGMTTTQAAARTAANRASLVNSARNTLEQISNPLLAGADAMSLLAGAGD